jgi:hypothetical protein
METFHTYLHKYMSKSWNIQIQIVELNFSEIVKYFSKIYLLSWDLVMIVLHNVVVIPNSEQDRSMSSS